MGAANLLLLAALAVGLGVLVQQRVQTALHHRPTFEIVSDGVYRLTQSWQLVPGLPPTMPVAVWLVRGDDGSWVLVDAGTFDNPRQRHATRLVEAVRAAIPAGERLAAIALTHGHVDHVGALPQLLAAFPDAPVLLHEREAPFLLEGRQYIPDTHPMQRLYVWIGLAPAGFAASMQLPADRFRLLAGASGNLSEWGAGELSYTLAPGHTPGHTAYLHGSGADATLLAGDTVSLIMPSLSWGAAAARSDDRVMAAMVPPAPLPALALRAQPTYICAPLPTCELRQMQRTACQLLARPDYARVLVAHDAGGGVWSGEAARAWAATAPVCQPAA